MQDGPRFWWRLQVCTINWLRPSTEAGPERYYILSWLQTAPKMAESFPKTIVQQAVVAYFQLSPENLNATKITSVKDFLHVESTLILTPEQSLELRSRNVDKNNLPTSKISISSISKILGAWKFYTQHSRSSKLHPDRWNVSEEQFTHLVSI